VAWLRTLWPEVTLAQPLALVAVEALSGEEVIHRTVLGWMGLLGPATARTLGESLAVAPSEIWKQLLRLEVAGTLIRGVFEGHSAASEDYDVEWCDRRLLQRIHKRTLGALRKQIEPVPPGTYMQWLLGWQHVAPQTQLSGEQGLLEALRGLEGFEAPAIEWERTLLPARVPGYDPRWLDSLCLAGVVGWGRVSPHPAFYAPDGGGPRRVVPTSMAPITFFQRDQSLWMDMCLSQRLIPEANLAGCLSHLAIQLRSCLERHGAIFAAEFTRICGVSAAEVGRALWELVAAGLVTADGFDSLRILIDPRRKQSVAANASRSGPARNISGRWSLLCAASRYANPETAGQAAERREAELSSACRVLLRRYGVLFRDLLERESTLPKWRDLQPMLRRMEARGEVRGGRFLSGFSGEQFALPEALDSLREARRSSVPAAIPIQVAAADPLNLVGIVIPGERVSAVPGKYVIFDTAAVAEACAPMHGEALAPPSMFAPIHETTPEAAR
jgi:ATP-dependent Lhr-like helicase